MRLMINGEAREVAGEPTVAGLLSQLGLDARKIAVERNLEIVRRAAFETTQLADGDRLEIVHFIGGGSGADVAVATVEDPFVVAGRTFTSRLLVGTGKYKDFEETARAIEASGAEIVTVAVRRVNVTDPSAPMLMGSTRPSMMSVHRAPSSVYGNEASICVGPVCTVHVGHAAWRPQVRYFISFAQDDLARDLAVTLLACCSLT